MPQGIPWSPHYILNLLHPLDIIERLDLDAELKRDILAELEAFIPDNSMITPGAKRTREIVKDYLRRERDKYERTPERPEDEDTPESPEREEEEPPEEGDEDATTGPVRSKPLPQPARGQRGPKARRKEGRGKE